MIFSGLLAIVRNINPFTGIEVNSVVEKDSKPPCLEINNRIIFSVFERTVIEACSVAILTSLTFHYAAKSAAKNSLIFYGIGTVILNLFFRAIRGYKDYQMQNISTRSCSYSAFIYSMFYEATGGVILHEWGHAMAARVLCRRSHIEMSWISVFKGSVIYSSNNGLSPIGNAIGKQSSTALIYAAGPLFSVAASISALVAGLWLRKTHPELSLYLRMKSVITVVHHVLYALSALKAPRSYLTHDFVRLWSFGLHPYVAAVFMIASLGISALTYLAIEQRAKTARESE